MVQVNYFQDRYLPNVRITSQSSDSGSDSQSFFQWELDKPTPSQNKTSDQLIFEGIDQFAKMTTSSNEARTVFAVNNIVQGKGAMGALTPFAIPYVIGKGIQAVQNYQQDKRTQAVRQATQNAGSSGSGGDTFNFNDNSGYGGTGTSSPSNVGPGGTLGGGV